MAKRKASKKKVPTKKGVLSISKQKKGVVLTRSGKRKAKRKQIRKRSQYDLIRSSIADYCKRNYGRRCSQAEVSDIYQTLKLRFIDNKSERNPIPIKEIQRTIDERLAYYKKQGGMPILLRDFEYYNTLAILYWRDGGYFKQDDVMNFDLRGIGEGIVRCTFNELPDVFSEDIRDRIKEWVSDVVDETGIEPSPPPTFVFDEELSDYEKREFTWVLDIDYEGEMPSRDDDDESAEDTPPRTGGTGTGERKRGKGAKKESKGKDEGKDESVPESVLIEREKTIQAREKTKQEAMELLRSGKIDLDTFKLLIS